MRFKRPRFINEWMDIKKQGGLKLLFPEKGLAGHPCCSYFLSDP